MPVHYGSNKLHFQTISSPLGTQIPQVRLLVSRLFHNVRAVDDAWFGRRLGLHMLRSLKEKGESWRVSLETVPPAKATSTRVVNCCITCWLCVSNLWRVVGLQP
jgi:hypothetical protein